MKRTLSVLILAAILSCKEEKPMPAKEEMSGKYSGTITGNFYPSDFPDQGQIPFTESTSFEITLGEVDGSMIGFDSIAVNLDLDDNYPYTFSISDIRAGGDLRVDATGQFAGDTLKMTGSYHFLDRSKRSFRFVGVKQ